MRRRTFLRVSLAGGAGLLAGAAAACSAAGPRAIAFGREQCAYCRMTVDDPRYAAQLATRTGKVHVFDSIECCAAWVADNATEPVRAAWVSDLAASGTLRDVSDVRFWRASAASGTSTPMGMGLLASSATAAPVAGAAGPLSWEEVRAIVAREGLGRGRGGHGGGAGAH